MPGGRIDVEVAIDGRGAPSQLQRAMAPALGQAKQFAGALGLAFGGAAVAASVKEIITIGNDYTTTMNTLQAVSRASGDQMAAAGARAKELGNDISLPGTSATDAAAAMTELAKGGFSVEQSMGAAKGTLQLAAAAQIDAASAATIQSQALQSFGLNADYAAKVSDVLANAANASSAEITDVAGALQQSGAVANQFGLSIEDTAATISLLANAGIQGSDAGTLLKSTLLALTDTSNPAQGAIEELGLTVYDAQGQFVGMSALFGQLDEAAGRMTPELYQAATATLFGSDAMRLAGVAAEQGQAGYDSMRVAVDRQGAAAEVAAAKTQGLPGALAAAQNAAETLALGIYDLVDGPLEGLATDTAKFVSDVTPGLISGFQSAGDVMAPVAGIVGDLVGAFADLPGPVQAVAVALAAVKFTGLDDSIGSTVSGWRQQLSDFRTEMQGEQELQTALRDISGGDSANPFQELTSGADDLAGSLEENTEPISELAAGLATLERRSPAVRNMAEGYRGVTARTREFATQQRAAAQGSGVFGSAVRNASARAAQFGGVVGGTAVAGMRGFGSAAKGAVGVLGGPWMVGIMAATYVVSQITGALGKADAMQQITSKSSADLATAQRDMAKAFQASNGAVDDTVLGSMAMQIGTVRDEASKLAAEAPDGFDFWGKLTAGANAAFTSETMDNAHTMYYDMRALGEESDRAASSFDELKLSNDELAQASSGTGAEFESLVTKLRGTSNGGADAIAKMRELRNEFVEARETAKNTTPGFFDLNDAVKTLSDESASASDRINAMKTALDVLSGKPIPLSDALQKYNEQVRQTAADTSDAWDKTQGWGDALVRQDGSVETSSANGSKLRDMLVAMKDATITAAEAGADMGPVWAQNETQMQQFAAATGLSVDQIRRMVEQEGLIQKNVEILASLRGADSVEQQLVVLKGLLDQNANGVEIPATALTDEAKARLIDLGVTVDTQVNGKPGVVRLSAPNAQVLAELQAVIDRNIPDKAFKVTATFESRGDALARQNLPANFIGPVIQQPLPQNAGGGEIKGPGTPTSDSILGIDRATGVPTSFVSTDEFVVAAAPYQANKPWVQAMNAGLVLPKLATGGEPSGTPGVTVDAMQRVKDWFASKDGNAYGYGASGPVEYDCSSYSSGGYSVALGLDPDVRRYTTESDFEALGFRPGMGGPNDMSIGVRRGGGGPYSHMGTTIGDVNAEASDFVQYGGNAKGASSFPLQWHLPGTSFVPPYTGAAPPAPAAPEQTPTDPAVTAAVTSDVPASARADTAAAVQSAVPGQLTTASQWSDALGGIAKDFVSGTVSDFLGYYEASDDMGPVVGAITAGVAAAGEAQRTASQAPDPGAPKQFSQEELASQAPVASGEPNWVEKIFASIQQNTPAIRLYDTGGAWAPGTLGANMSGEWEEVLTGGQRRTVMEEIAVTRAERRAAAVGAPAAAPPAREPRPISVVQNGYDRSDLAGALRRARTEERWEMSNVPIQQS